MPRTKRSRVIGARRAEIWRLVSDPNHLSRWWPKVVRVEGVQERARGTGTLWTKVLETQAGRQVRADYRCLYSKEPTRYVWEQELEGSPFERVLRSSVTSVDLAEADGDTRVTLEMDQGLRGLSRLGGFMVRRATRGQLDEALDGLERALGRASADRPASQGA
jgi:carbon monoxide dehydrogenase subunit G